MKTITILIMAMFMAGCATVSREDAMQADVDQAAAIIEHFDAIPEAAIPPTIMRAARGLAILNVTKAGFIGSVRGGTGVVVQRTEKGWSGPAAISTGGLGFGFQAGVEVTELIILLNSPAAVEAFARGGTVNIGGAMSATAGPLGRAAEGAVGPQAAMYSYSRSQGLFAGISLEGTALNMRDHFNEAYYGRPVEARDILSGKVPPPAGARRLLAALSKY
jgi:SH3 domain-containing YSC84-like protein 1